MNQIVESFLKQHRFLLDDADFEKDTDELIRQMEAGCTTSPASLQMIPSYIPDTSTTMASRQVIVIDAGGTNLRVSLVRISADGFETSYFKQYSMPGSRGLITHEEFFLTLVSYLKPVIEESDTIGFCFSYPAIIRSNQDGMILGFNKGVEITGMKQVLLGKTLNQFLIQEGFEQKKITVLNDTVATLLGGKATYLNASFDSYIGFILGTGTNSCYIEANRLLTKDAYLLSQPGYSIINLESGGYQGFPLSDFDEEVQNLSDAPETQHMEKMISGAYQGALALSILKAAAKEHILPDTCRQKVLALQTLEAKDVSQFLLHPGSVSGVLGALREGIDQEAEDILYELLKAISKRTAYLCAVNMKAIVKKRDIGRHPSRPTGISIEGSTFYQAAYIKEELQYYLKQFLETDGYYVQLIQAEQATIYGSAIAAIS